MQRRRDPHPLLRAGSARAVVQLVGILTGGGRRATGATKVVRGAQHLPA